MDLVHLGTNDRRNSGYSLRKRRESTTSCPMGEGCFMIFMTGRRSEVTDCISIEYALWISDPTLRIHVQSIHEMASTSAQTANAPRISKRKIMRIRLIKSSKDSDRISVQSEGQQLPDSKKMVPLLAPYPMSLKLRLLSRSTAASSRPARTCTRSLAITFLGRGKNAQWFITCKPHHSN